MPKYLVQVSYSSDGIKGLFKDKAYISAACLSLTVSAAGLARCQTTPLLTIEETDSALNKEVPYRPPGR
jgi:hypothetical protein